ncbi:protein PET117 homolog, mitochondrial [Orussus abietinus]|uniref:protein PET117 homolog, mitochondrial n=1 Tax=Orussus abietinus TaxID=222816 RepID=UPI00062667C8|nr:protein PET117 homolog, mitochondrial [Orussus abietinus]
MSAVSTIVVGTVTCVTLITVYYVHYKQSYDRDQIHVGVIRDIERQERRKAENVRLLQEQAGLTDKLRHK